MRFLVLFAIIFIVARPASAQTQTTLLSLNSPSTALQTGQTYEIAISVANSPDLWLADFEINYDPAHLYIMGSRSGSPVQVGELFAGTGAVVARNSVQQDTLMFTVSKAGDVPAAAGTGVIGRFRIYPLAAGTTQLLFESGDLRQLNAARDGTDSVTFTPVLLELTITGDTVEIPVEGTATPTPSPTATPASAISSGGGSNQAATLVNVTAAPATPEATNATPSPTLTEIPANPTGPLIAVGIGLIVIALVGLAWLVRSSRARKSIRNRPS